MNTFDYSALLPPLSLGLINLFFAGVLHRAVVRNSVLLRRRHFFESLAVLAFAVATILSAAGFALWRDNPSFVLVCSASWALLCIVLAVITGYRNRRRTEDELVVPDLWRDPSEPPDEVRPVRDPVPESTPSRSAAGSKDERTMVSLDAFTRARLKKARRDRSDERAVRDGRFRMNRIVYDPEETGARGPDEREER